jgi:FkbH-like protein
MTEERLRQILAEWFKIAPEEITDQTSVGNPASFDSLAIMNLVLTAESEMDRIFTDDEIASLVSWPAIKTVMLDAAQPAFYKALVLDADGTLWGDVLSEGGAKMSETYREVQATYLSLKERGVILALATKNEPADVDFAFNAPNYSWGGLPPLLVSKDFTVIKAGWGNKVASLKDIAKTLNIGLDAMVFVDDSPFECEYVRSHLPEVKVVQVPKNLADYPRMAQEVASLFPTLVDVSKTDEYRALAEAEKTRPQFASDEEFLASLDIQVELHCDRYDEIPRIAELTQKANQFNLTTRRYAEGQIADWMAKGYVYSIHVKDKFGDQGLVGVVIVETGRIDTFLLSCRVLGRGIERAVWNPIFDTMREIGWQWVTAQYIPTSKNEQVRNFWPSLGFEPRIGGEWVHRLDTLDVPCPLWITVTLVV